MTAPVLRQGPAVSRPLFEDLSGAEFDPKRPDLYRYRLWRRWSERAPVCWIMCNPSIGDETRNDPTLRRCMGFARAWGAGGILVVNLFALRSTVPEALYGHADPVGPGNDAAIRACAGTGYLTVAAWGVHGTLHGRGDAVRRMLAADGVTLHHLGLTADGQPMHPLYRPADTVLERL